MNSVHLIGRLATEVELSYTPNTQTAVARFTLAVNRPRKDGQEQGADFIRITVWGKQAENCKQWIGKGRQVAVEGRIETGSYTKRDGQKVYTSDVVANVVEFLQGNRQEQQNPQPRQQNYPQQNYPQQNPQQNYYNDAPYEPVQWSAVDDNVPY